jgi:two-component system, NarL family, nitrate/nitrite response regulator NarL
MRFGYNQWHPPREETAMEPSHPQAIRVFVVSDVCFYREGLAQVLASMDQVEVLGTAAGTAEGLRLVAQLQPDVVLLDTARADGVWMAHQLADTTPGTRIVALAVPEAEEDLIVLVEAGVLGYVTRDQSLDEVVAAVISVVREEMACSPKMRTLVVKRVRALAAEFRAPVHARLTRRQLEILDLIAEGLSNKEIAHELSIELATVKNHVHSILEKLQVHTRTAAVAEVKLWTRPTLSTLAGRRIRGRSIALTLMCSPEMDHLTAILYGLAA